MSFTISHRPDHGLVCEYRGRISGAIIEAAQNQVAETLRGLLKKPLFLIVDHSRSIPAGLDTEDIRKTAFRTKALLALAQEDFFIALVAGEGLAFGLARMWHAYLGEDHARVNILKTRVEAEGWVFSKLAGAD